MLNKIKANESYQDRQVDGYDFLRVADLMELLSSIRPFFPSKSPFLVTIFRKNKAILEKNPFITSHYYLRFIVLNSCKSLILNSHH